MRKSIFFVAGFVFLALILTGCSQTVDPDAPTNPSSTDGTKIHTIEAVTTIGTMTAPQTASDGSTTLSVTDSSGGTYNFKQPLTPSTSIRSGSTNTGGTWDYINSKGVKQFAGSYTGDIATSGANNLNLEVKQAADPSGKMQEVTEAKSFTFEVSDTGTFSATIPAVEIIVKEETTPSIPAVTKIKTVTLKTEYSNSQSYYNASNLLTCDFYSDNTFKMYTHETYSIKQEEIDFSYEQKGIAYTGTYTGTPQTEGEMILDVQKMAKGLDSIDPQKVYQAYKNGEKSVTFTLTEDDLVPMKTSMPILISGSTLEDTGHAKVSYTKNSDGSTSIQVNITGDEASSFKLRYATSTDNSYSSDSLQDGSFGTPITISGATEDTTVEIELYIPGTSSTSPYYSGITLIRSIHLKPGYKAEINEEIRKISVPFSIEGNQTQYGGEIKVHTNFVGRARPVSSSEQSIDFYCFDSNDITAYNLFAEDSSGSPISAEVDVYLDKDNPPTSPVTIKLNDKLTEGITITGYPEDSTFTDEEKKTFRFAERADGNLVFYIPTGTGTDGEFLTCTVCKSATSCSVENDHIRALFEATYSPIDHLDYQAYDNYNGQFTGLVDNMKDVVWYLTTKKGLTIAGAELLEQIK